MGVTRTPKIDCDKTDDLGWEIIQLEETIHHNEAYYENIDSGLLRIKLKALQKQQREKNNE